MSRIRLFIFNFFSKNSQEWREKYNAEWRQLRAKVLKRDKYKCQNPACGKEQTRTRRLAVHHIEDASSNPLKILTESNLISLCHGDGECHSNFHKWNGGFHKSCNRRQLKAWFYSQEKGASMALMAWVTKNIQAFYLYLILSIAFLVYILARVII